MDLMRRREVKRDFKEEHKEKADYCKDSSAKKDCLVELVPYMTAVFEVARNENAKWRSNGPCNEHECTVNSQNAVVWERRGDGQDCIVARNCTGCAGCVVCDGSDEISGAETVEGIVLREGAVDGVYLGRCSSAVGIDVAGASRQGAGGSRERKGNPGPGGSRDLQGQKGNVLCREGGGLAVARRRRAKVSVSTMSEKKNTKK